MQRTFLLLVATVFSIFILAAPVLAASRPTVNDMVSALKGRGLDEVAEIREVMLKTIGFGHGLAKASSAYAKFGQKQLFCFPEPDSDAFEGELDEFKNVLAKMAKKYVEDGRGDEDLYGVAQTVAMIVFVCDEMSDEWASKIKGEELAAEESSSGKVKVEKAVTDGVYIAPNTPPGDEIPITIVKPTSSVHLKYDLDLTRTDYMNYFRHLSRKGFSSPDTSQGAIRLREEIKQTVVKHGRNPALLTAMGLIDYYGLAGRSVKGKAQYELFEEAAASLDPVATFMLAQAYWQGTTYHNQDKEEGFRLFMLAAREGNYGPAQNVVGCIIGLGHEGVAVKDISRAFVWLSMARNNGFKLAAENLSALKRVMRVEDIERATELAKTKHY